MIYNFQSKYFVSFFLTYMNKQATNDITNKKTSLGKRKKSEPEGNPDGSDLDSVVMNEPRKKMQKVTHSNTTDVESAAKMKSALMLEPSFMQTKMACAIGNGHTITLSDDGTVYSFGRNSGELGLGHTNEISLPTRNPNLPQINVVSCGFNFTVCVDYEGFIWSFGYNSSGQLGTGNKRNYTVIPQKLLNLPPVLSVSCGCRHTLIITNDDNLWSCGQYKSE